MSALNTPWRRDPQQPRTIIGANGRTICTAHLSGLPTGEADALAVADMILAAPEMAAELQRLRAALDIDHLSNIIRRVDGSNSLGAGALAEKIVEAIKREIGA